MSRIFKWVGSVIVAVLVVEWLLAVNFVPLANSTLLLMMAVAALSFAIMVCFGLFIISMVFRDRRDERQTSARDRWDERQTHASLTRQAFRQAEVSQQAALMLAGYVASGLRVRELRGGQEVLEYPDGRRLLAEHTDLTSDELDFIKEEQENYN